MAAQTEPISGLSYGWALGENNWNTGMDANLLKIGRVGVHLKVLDRNLATPPASPTLGDRYIVPSGATGAWSGKTNQIAVCIETGSPINWAFYVPSDGWLAWVSDERKLCVFEDGSPTQWSILAGL